MRIKKNGKVINLTESDLRRIVTKVIKEQDEVNPFDAEANAAHNANITKTASDKIAADKTAEENKPKAKLHYLEKGYSIGGQEVLFKYPTMKLGNEITDNANAPMVVRGNNNTILVDRETHKIKKGSIVDTFKNLKVTSSPNGSMSTAYADFMGYVVSQKMTSQTTFASKSKTSQYIEDCTTIDQCVWVTPQYRKMDEKEIQVELEDRETKVKMPVKVTYDTYVNGNDVLITNKITKLQWLVEDKDGKRMFPVADTKSQEGRAANKGKGISFSGVIPVNSTDGKYGGMSLTAYQMRDLMILIRGKLGNKLS